MADSRYAEIRAALSEPGFYPHAPARVTVHETHTSCVFVVDDLVYKLKKPVNLGFLDYSSLEARRRFCREELRLNRRLAPRIYLAVRSVVEGEDGRLALGDGDDPRALEFLVEMRRYDEALTLAGRLASHKLGVEDVHKVAARIAEFHASAEPVEPAGDPRTALKRASDETFATLLQLVPEDLEPAVAAAQRFSNAFFVARRDTFFSRAREGLVRDGHGDLRAEHVVLEDPIAIVDCVEFDPALRRIDVAHDLAFLAMDLERLGPPELAHELVAAYRQRGGDPGDDGLLAFFAAHRAWVRAKVALLRARQQEEAGEEPGAMQDAGRKLLELGGCLVWRARQPLLLVVCGLSGSGKSYLANAIREASGVDVISSDAVRKRLAGVDALERAPLGVYREDFNERTYHELGRLAAAETQRTGTAIVDATFRRSADRRAFAEAAGDVARFARFVQCEAPEPVRLGRVDERLAAGPSVSDATTDVARKQAFEPLAEVPAERHLVLRTDRPVAECVWTLEAWLDGQAVVAADAAAPLPRVPGPVYDA